MPAHGKPSSEYLQLSWIASTESHLDLLHPTNQEGPLYGPKYPPPPNMELRKAGPAYNDVTGEPWVGKCFWLALTELSYVRVCMKTPLKAAKVMGSPYNSNRHQGSLKDYWNRRHSFVTLMLNFPSRLLNQHLKIWIGSFLCRATIHMKMNTWNNLERQY